MSPGGGQTGYTRSSAIANSTGGWAYTAGTYNGTTTVNGGVLTAGNTAALGSTSGSLVLTSGTLDLATDTSVNAYNTTVNGNATIFSNRATAGVGITQTLGTLSIGANTLSIDYGGNVTSGTAIVAFGAVTQSGASTFDVANGARLNLGALLSNSNLTKAGAGILQLTGS